MGRTPHAPGEGQALQRLALAVSVVRRRAIVTMSLEPTLRELMAVERYAARTHRVAPFLHIRPVTGAISRTFSNVFAPVGERRGPKPAAFCWPLAPVVRDRRFG